MEEQNKFRLPPEMSLLSNAESSSWSITLMAWALVETVHARWSNVVLREKRRWLIRHAETGSVVRLRYFSLWGKHPVLYSTNSCSKMHRLHLFQNELKGLAHFNFQAGLCNLIRAFARGVKMRVGVMESWKNCLQSRAACFELFTVWPNICREW